MTPQERKVFELALEFIERVNKDGWILADFEPQMYEVMTAINEALAKPEQIPPSAYSNTHQPEPPPECPMDSYGDGNIYRGQRSRDSVVKTITLAQPEQEPVYIAPPQRTWEGLSVSEINDLVENTKYKDYRGLVATTETKLKEKNYG